MRGVILLGLTISGCAGGSGKRAEPSRRYANVIVLEEIESRSWASAYELVSTLRANWLHRRGEDTIISEPGDVQILINGVRQPGGSQLLHQTPVSGILAIRYHDPISASSRWGTGFQRGAIDIELRRR